MCWNWRAGAPRGRRSRRICGRGGVLGTLLLVAAVSSACDRPGDEPALVAVNLGSTFLDGARLAIDEELERGAIPGFDTIMIPETSNRSDVTVMHAEDLVTLPSLRAVIGHSNSTSSMAAAPVYNAHEVVQIAPTSTSPAYSQAGDYSFRLVPSDDGQGQFLAERVADEFPDGTRLAVFFVNDDYGRGLRTRFREHLDTERHPIVAEIPHVEEGLDEGDVRSGIQSAAVARPDVIVWLARAIPLTRFLPALRREFGAIPIYGGDGVGTTAPPRDAALWKGIIYADFFDPGATPELRAFTDRYRARFGQEAGTPEILTYDAMRLLLTALREGHRSGPEIRDWLGSLGRERPPFDGVSGPISFDADGDVERTYVLRSFGEQGDR